MPPLVTATLPTPNGPRTAVAAPPSPVPPKLTTGGAVYPVPPFVTATLNTPYPSVAVAVAPPPPPPVKLTEGADVYPVPGLVKVRAVIEPVFI